MYYENDVQKRHCLSYRLLTVKALFPLKTLLPVTEYVLDRLELTGSICVFGYSGKGASNTHLVSLITVAIVLY